MSKEKSKNKLKWWAITAIVVSSIIVLLGSSAGLAYGIVKGANYVPHIEKSIDVDPNATLTTITSKGKGLYDKDGNNLTLKGVNFGNWLIQEGWMSVNSLGPSYNEDGSYKKINEDGTIEEYEETYQEELDEAFNTNPNLTYAQRKELWTDYYYSFCKPEDFINIKNLGFNVVRLPMYYRNFMEGEKDALTMREDAFVLLDYFLEQCKANNLFAILDMHGVVGGQSSYEHSGTRDCEFWDNEIYQQEMADLWQNIALHYIDNRPDLAYTIATYDLVNEPTGGRDRKCTGRKQWDVMDKLYNAIRQVDPYHVITFEGCWYYNTLPNPAKYHWENVMYEFHFYNWSHNQLNNDLYFTLMDALLLQVKHYKCPFYIGEFNLFDDKAEWIKRLNQFDERYFSWTFWTYKVVSVGYWDSSWGLYVNKLNLRDEQKKLDLRTATYEEIKAVWTKQGTSESYNSTGFLMDMILSYNQSK